MIKGEIWWADLPENFYGSEPGKRRPVLVIQNDAINRSTIKTVICALITSNVNQAKVPGNIFLEKSNSGLEKQSVANFSQIFTIDKTRFTDSGEECHLKTIYPSRKYTKKYLGNKP